MPDIAQSRPTAGAPIESAWGGAVHDAVEGVQSGTVQVPAPVSATSQSATVTFPRAYTAPPVVVVTPAMAAANRFLMATVNTITTTGFGVLVTQKTDAAFATVTPVNWVAVGTPA